MDPLPAGTFGALDHPGAKQMAAWTLTLVLDSQFKWPLSSDPHLFSLIYASCASAVSPPDVLCGDVEAGAVASDQLLSTLKDLQRQFGSATTGAFAHLYLQGVVAHDFAKKNHSAYTQAMKDWREHATSEASTTITSEEHNIDQLSALLELKPVERDILTFELNRHRPGFSQLYSALMAPDGMTLMILSAIFEVGLGQTMDALAPEGTLVRSGLLSVQERPLMIETPSPYLRAVLLEAKSEDDKFFERFVKPLNTTSSTASFARLDDRDREILVRALAAPMPEDGLHMLVYGPSSVDKRDLIARLLEEEPLSAYVVAAKSVPSSELPTWVFIAQKYLQKQDPDAILIIERAEQALASRRGLNVMSLLGMIEDDAPEEGHEERASDKSLTSSPLRCIWVTDRAPQLSERNLGAFIFHCEARPGSRADRRERISQVVSEHGLSEDLERHLATYSLIGARQVGQAAALAKLLTAEQPRPRKKTLVASGQNVSHENIIRRAVSQSQKALGRDHTEELRDSVTTYSLANLNIDGAFTPQQIIDALRKRPKGSLCFHGIPGAGKTQLAEYMAVELDLPLIMRSASDILSKWLGDSEQNIKAMFAEAEAEGALLFLDEADSFLRDRALARAEWAVTQVNEILQRIERFNGIFIAATNLMDSMDAAAMRRFTWKLEFKSLRPEQAWSMFCTEAEIKSSKYKRLRPQLEAIRDLAPGDFATVKRQANMLGTQLTPETWIEQLAAEAKAKMMGLRRQGLGFE